MRVRMGICMWKASRSLSRALFAVALLAPMGAWAGSAPPAGSAKAARQVENAAHHADPSRSPTIQERELGLRHRHHAHAHEHRGAELSATESAPKENEKRLNELPPGAIEVSTQDLNRFIFAAPVVKGPIFPADAPVLGAPVYLDDNRQVLIQFAPGSEKPFQMVVELSGGQVKSYLLAPRPIPGITYRASDVVPPQKIWKASTESTDAAQPAQRADITLLRSVVMGEVPDAFYPTRLPNGASFDKFNIVPRQSWSDGAGRRILIYALVSVHGQAAVVAAPEFYHKGMSAILLTGEVVDATHSPTLYIVEGVDRG